MEESFPVSLEIVRTELAGGERDVELPRIICQGREYSPFQIAKKKSYSTLRDILLNLD